MKYVLLFFIILFSCEKDPENLFLPAMFSDGMVIQRDTTVSIWGKSLPQSNIRLYPSWGKTISTISDSNGHWKVFLKTIDGQQSFSLKIESGNDKIVIKDILMGEVWLAAGQSNMEMNFDYCCNSTDRSEDELQNANYEKIRMFNVKKQYSLKPISRTQGRWKKAIKDSIKDFSAVGYFFAKNLHKTLDVPIGIIHSSWGGSDAESWISKNTINSLNEIDQRRINKEKIQSAKNSEKWFSKFESVTMPSAGFDLMLGTYFERSDTTINYLNYFLDDWRKIDFEDKKHILSQNNYASWPQLTLPGLLNDIFGTKDFNGVVVLKNQFYIDSISTDFEIDMGEISLDWAGELREYDFFINGKKIGTTFGEDENGYYNKLGENYKKDYSTYPFTYYLNQKIPHSNIKLGRNEIAIRVIGSGVIKPIKISSSGSQIPINNIWRYRVSAEIYKQLNDYYYPYMDFYLYNKKTIDISERPPINSYGFNEPSSLFNGMINPLIPYTIKGVIWYQGENNAFRHEEYEKLFSSLILDWRKKWKYEFPFYYVQIAPYFNYYSSNALLREAQRKVLKIPKTGMAVTLDIGEKYDIHPSNKHEVGYRLARYALKNDYKEDLIESGPHFKNIFIDQDIIKVFFNFSDNGLVFDEGNCSEFEIAGDDKKYFKANVVNQNEYLEVFSGKVLQPKYVRYAWSDTSTATLFNVEGLPASSFSSDNE